jgi:hypothetical protein
MSDDHLAAEGFAVNERGEEGRGATASSGSQAVFGDV